LSLKRRETHINELRQIVFTHDSHALCGSRMVRSTEIIERIKNALPIEEWLFIEASILELKAQQVGKPRKTIVSQINHIIIENALKNDRPQVLLAMPDIHKNEVDDLFSRIVQHYIASKRGDWLDIIYSLGEKLGKKSDQSRIFAMVARDLIDAGVSEKNPALIENGMMTLDRISFRKYRSDIMIDIIPLLIVWAVTIHDKKLLCTSFHLIGEIGDISKRSVLHAELSKALATIAIQKKDRTAYFYSIQSAAEIHQKIRRQSCIVSIIERGSKSTFGREMADISRFIDNFAAISPEAQLEIISALTAQLLERTRDKDQILSILRSICGTRPSATSTIIIDLLGKAERSGELWYLSSALELQQHISDTGIYPLREMIHAAIAVATATGNMRVLNDLIPVIEKNSSTLGASRTFLQFSQVMLSCGDFGSALDLFGKINHETENLPQYSDILTHLLKAEFLNDRIQQVKETLIKNLNENIAAGAVYRAAIELSKETSFEKIVSHIRSMNDLVLLHQRHDYLFYECITILGDRGFLTTNDPGILIHLADSIGEQEIKERAISSIVIKIAKIGVQLKNRDYLQRAVGLTGEIEGQDTRSATLSSIIDEASLLAAEQGDLDLLLRMRAWSSSLLEQELAVYAMANIIEGVIKYAIDRKSSDALEEAYLIAKEINDPSLKTELFERIAESFVRIGCLILKEPSSMTAREDFNAAKRSFSRSLLIIREDLKSPQVSLKIAGIIDIIITHSKSSSNPDFIIPLAMFAAEIPNTFERDAMMSRIISSLQTEVIYPGSTDPYEIMAYLLQRSDMAKEDRDVISLISRILRMIGDPFVRLSGLTGPAESLIRLQDIPGAKKVLQEVEGGLKDLPAEYQKILLLSDLAILYCRIDTGTASEYLQEGIQRLRSVESDRQTVARRQIVFAIVRINTVMPEGRWVDMALLVVRKIADPIEYINSLIAVYSMIRGDRMRSNEILHYMTEAVEKISSPYEKISTLLDIIPFAIQSTDSDTPIKLLRKAELLTKKINIQYIADRMRDTIAQIYIMLAEKNADSKYMDSAIAVIRTIDADEVRQNQLMKVGYPETYEIPPSYVKIKALSEKMITDGFHQNQVTALERLVLTVADRGREALFFSDLAVFFRKGKEEKIAKRMLQDAIKEARIIRPLSRRSYILCDIALKLHAAGCERTAQDILDNAIDAATNIRQSSLRDEVFDELGIAIRLMQEMER
jgi:tetratricopeptide (TPR) repeat protein